MSHSTPHLLHEVLRELVGKQEPIAITIHLPLFRKDPALRKKNEVLVRNAIRESLQIAQKKAGNQPGILARLEEQFNVLVPQLPLDKPPQSIVIVVSPSYRNFFALPFSVEKKVVVDRTFEIRAILYAVNRWIPYYLFLVQDQQIIPYSGIGTEVRRLHDLEEVFRQLRVVPDIEKPTRGGQNPDETIVAQHAFAGYASRVFAYLRGQLNFRDIPVVLIANPQELGIVHRLAEDIGIPPENILRITKDLRDIDRATAEEVYQLIQEWIVAHRRRLKNRIERYFKVRRVASGIVEVAQTAYMGAVETLLVEENFSVHAWTKEQIPLQVQLSPPDQPEDWHEHADLVDDIIEFVLQYKGRVFFFPEGDLKDYGRILALLRFA